MLQIVFLFLCYKKFETFRAAVTLYKCRVFYIPDPVRYSAMDIQQVTFINECQCFNTGGEQ